MASLNLFGLINLVKSAAPEALGKFIYELFTKLFGKTVEEKQEKEKEITKKLEADSSRIIDALKELKKDGEKILKLINKADKGQLKNVNGKKITKRRFVYFLTLLKPERLKDTLRSLNNETEKEIMNYMTIFDDDFWGDLRHKLTSKSKKSSKDLLVSARNFLLIILPNVSDKFQKLANASLEKLDSEIDEAIRNINALSCSENENHPIRTTLLSNIIKTKLKKFWNDYNAFVIGSIIFFIIGLSTSSEYENLNDFLQSPGLFTGILIGSYAVIYFIYHFIKLAAKKISGATQDAAMAWIKAVRGAARFLNGITSLIGYPTIEIARFNTALTEGAAKTLTSVLSETARIAKIILISITVLFPQFFLMQYIPGSKIYLVVVLISSLVVAFSFMGLVEPIIKPLKDKPLRNIIRPISLIVPIVGTITIIYMYSFYNHVLFYTALNVLVIWIIVLLSLSFLSYHGKYISNAGRKAMRFTFLVSLIVLIFSGNLFGIKNTEAYKYLSNKSTDGINFLAESNMENEINLYELKDSTVLIHINYQKYQGLKKVIDENIYNNPKYFKKGELVSVIEKDIPYGTERLARIARQNPLGAYNDFGGGDTAYTVLQRYLKKIDNQKNSIKNNNSGVAIAGEKKQKKEIPRLLGKIFILPPREKTITEYINKGETKKIYSDRPFIFVEKNNDIKVTNSPFVYNANISGGMLTFKNPSSDTIRVGIL